MKTSRIIIRKDNKNELKVLVGVGVDVKAGCERKDAKVTKVICLADVLMK